jgi:hypothetical protein
VPHTLSGLLSLSYSKAPWAAQVAVSAPGPAAAPPPAPRPAAAAGTPASRLVRRLASLLGASLPRNPLGGLNAGSALDAARSRASATRELFRRGAFDAPGPESLLAVPVLASRRGSGAVGSDSGYSASAMLDPALQDRNADGAAQGPGPGAAGPSPAAPPGPPGRTQRLLAGSARVWWAPEADCLALAAGRAGVVAAHGGSTRAMRVDAARGTAAQESCFITQAAVYIYNPCAVNPSADAAADSPAAQAAPPLAPGPPSPLGPGLEAAVAGDGSDPAGVAGGFVEVVAAYSPYTDCLRRGLDTLADVTYQVRPGRRARRGRARGTAACAS